MRPVIGYFDSRGNAVIRISVHGAVKAAKQEFEAIIDTGFTGFLSMPMVQAFPLALVLLGTASVTFGDGKTEIRLTAFGTVTLGEEEQHGVITLEWGPTDVLVGMDFLRKFKKALLVSESGVALMDVAVVKAAMEEGRKQADTPPSDQGRPDPSQPDSRVVSRARHHRPLCRATALLSPSP
jgi:predicted aspartyl protease